MKMIIKKPDIILILTVMLLIGIAFFSSGIDGMLGAILGACIYFKFIHPCWSKFLDKYFHKVRK